MTFALHGVIKNIGGGSPIKGLHRVVWVNEASNRLFTVPIPTWQKDEATPRYYKGPQERDLAEFLLLKLTGDIVETTVAPHRLSTLSDDQIRKRYPRRAKPMSKKRERTDCAVLQFRDERWRWVEPICKYLEENRAEAFETGELGRLVKARAAELPRQTWEVYDALHRVLAHACGKNSILPAHCRSGGG